LTIDPVLSAENYVPGAFQNNFYVGGQAISHFRIPGKLMMSLTDRIVTIRTEACSSAVPRSGATSTTLRKLTVVEETNDLIVAQLAKMDLDVLGAGPWFLCLDEEEPLGPGAASTAYVAAPAFQIGTVTRESEADLQRTWILDNDMDTAIEVTGTDMEILYDRIMIVECGEACGKASATLNMMPDPTANSTASLMLFPVRFASPGSYKVCFCGTGAEDALCEVDDYVVELGRVEVSEVTCTLEDPRFRTRDCHRQAGGGFACGELLA